VRAKGTADTLLPRQQGCRRRGPGALQVKRSSAARMKKHRLTGGRCHAVGEQQGEEGWYYQEQAARAGAPVPAAGGSGRRLEHRRWAPAFTREPRLRTSAPGLDACGETANLWHLHSDKLRFRKTFFQAPMLLETQLGLVSKM